MLCYLHHAPVLSCDCDFLSQSRIWMETDLWCEVSMSTLLSVFCVSVCSQSKQLLLIADIRSLCKKTGWPERRVEVWFRRRRNQDRPGLQKRFCEARWVYVNTKIFGQRTIRKPWFYDLKEVWAEFPKQSMLPSQYWYYTLEMGFYLSLLLSLAFDVKRKDFKEQVIHHVATLTLLSFSWISNYIRIGTLVMAVHDSSDIVLEGGKLFNYAQWEKTANVMFVIFTTVFMVTRLVIFPFWLIHCTWVYPLERFDPFFGYYFFNIMLLVLQILHVYWAFLITRMAYKFVFSKVCSKWFLPGLVAVPVKKTSQSYSFWTGL
uniref:Ceramide synthase 3b n=1 Tax=Xiphophorus couchianus TaxID=32473 RepID=A0A3B5MUI1_9TELE